MMAFPGRIKKKKSKTLKYCTLTEYLNELKKCVNGDICRELERESDIYKNNLDILLQQYELKPLPINVLKTKEPPAIDGKLNDPVWQNAQALTDFFILKKNTLAKVQTHVRMAYDENNLYLAAVMDEPYPDKIKARFTERDTEVFIDDCFEIFIGSKEDLKDYYHIVINSRGTVFDDKRNIGDYTKWNGTYDIAASINKNSWQLEMAIPWSNFDFAGKGQKLFTCNFARERYADGRTYCTYAPLFGAGFHLPQWFWLLKLED
jgi:hypothetical protein